VYDKSKHGSYSSMGIHFVRTLRHICPGKDWYVHTECVPVHVVDFSSILVLG